jgi:alpha-amylase/alpha-mannosidase (GH57 family)
MVPLAAQAGFQWMATDELILARTLGATFSRDGHGHLEQPERLYLPYVVRTGGASIACAFRDHVLSDLIGFTYAGWSADSAADDFVGRIVEAGRRFRARSSGGEDALIPIILDGENAWEHFEGGGRPFLRALYGRLDRHPELRTVTMSEGCADAVQELPGIFPGRGSTRTSISGSVTRTTSGPGVRWLTPGMRSPTPRLRQRRHRRSILPRRTKKC